MHIFKKMSLRKMSEIQLEKVPNILDFSCIIKITTNVQALMPHDQDTGGGIHGKEDDHGRKQDSRCF